jgi:hypothetical protein
MQGPQAYRGMKLVYVSYAVRRVRTYVGKDHTSELLEGLELTVALNGGTNLFRTGSDSEERLGLDAVGHGVLSNGGSTAHVLVGRVGAGTDKTDLELLGPLVGLDSLLELADGCS